MADVLSDALRMLRLSGAVLFRADFSAPWNVSTPDSSLLAQMLMPGAGRLVLFHVVTGGQCWAQIADGPRTDLRAGDVVVFPYGDPHVMGVADEIRCVSVTELLPPPPWDEQPTIRCGGDGVETNVVCGFLRCDDALFSPALRMLPPMFSIDTATGGRAQWMDFVVGQTLQEAGDDQLGSNILVTRMAELMLLDVLRRYMAQEPSEQRGLLCALQDPQLTQALELLHASPSKSWTVEDLGREVGMSRSNLAAKFKDALGMPPMQYATSLRLQQASQLLRDTNASIAEIAAEVGYESEAAFSKAFRRHAGQPPATWRKSA